jgi:hypothetical protein
MWYNRNSRFGANDWFNNRNGVKRPFLNQNDFGASVGGPIKRDKLLFFANYSGQRRPAGTTVDRTILTPTARQGIFQYSVGGVVQQFNVLQAQGLTINPYIQRLLDRTPREGNNTTIGDGLNTTGYSFTAQSKRDRDNITAKVDYNLSTSNVFSGTFVWNQEIADRSDVGPFYSDTPPVYNDNRSKLLSLSHRWTPTPTLTNELRGGFNRSPGLFILRRW